MGSIQIDTTKHKFSVSDNEGNFTITTEPINSPGLYDNFVNIEISLDPETTEEKAWEIAYLLNNYAQTVKVNDPGHDSYISE
jgi:hypothetical protein